MRKETIVMIYTVIPVAVLTAFLYHRYRKQSAQ